MKRRLPRKAERAPVTFKSWKRRTPRMRIPDRVPAGSTVLSDDGTVLLTTTPRGTVIGWDTCGRCGVHMRSCACASPSAPRSVTYIWHQDNALQKGEEWSPDHPDYRKDFVPPGALQAIGRRR